MGTIFKRPGTNYWTIVYYVTDAKGRRRQRWKSCKGMSKPEAKRLLDDIEHEIAHGTYLDKDHCTLGEYLAKWLDSRKPPKISELSHLRYSQMIRNNVDPHIGHIRFHKLQPIHLENFYDDLLKEGRVDGKGGLSSKTVHNIHVMLHSALRQAVKWRLRNDNPCDYVDAPRAKSKEIDPIDRGAALRLVEVVGRSKYRIPVMIALSTGLRRSEIVALRWEDFDEQNRCILVRRGAKQLAGEVVIGETKGKKTAALLLPPSMVALLKQHRSEQQRAAKEVPDYQDQGWICTHPDGRPFTPGSVTSAFKHIAKSAGISISIHGLRHTISTHELNAGVPLHTVSKRRIHATVAVTGDIYGHRDLDQQRFAAEVAESLINPDFSVGIKVVEGVVE